MHRFKIEESFAHRSRVPSDSALPWKTEKRGDQNSLRKFAHIALPASQVRRTAPQGQSLFPFLTELSHKAPSTLTGTRDLRYLHFFLCFQQCTAEKRKVLEPSYLTVVVLKGKVKTGCKEQFVASGFVVVYQSKSAPSPKQSTAASSMEMLLIFCHPAA